jgi:hypothetical protein
MPAAKLKAVPAKPTLGSIADEMWELREQKRAIAAQEKEINAKLETLEADMLVMLDEQGIDSAKGKKGNVSLGKPMTSFSFDTEGGADGFEKFMAFVAKNKYFHLVQRRVSEPACREIFESKGVVPGLKPFIKRKLNLTTVS